MHDPGTMGDHPTTLPTSLPLFPLREAVLLPRHHLPLQIFEPRYHAMFDYALAHGRLVGLIRPRQDEEDEISPPLYAVGCAGRISSFAETDDGPIVLTLTGISRFRLIRDELLEGGFRLGHVDFAPYCRDLTPPDDVDEALHGRLTNILPKYLDTVNLSVDWDTVKTAPLEGIVNAVAAACPFEPDEEQALLETPSLEQRAETLITMMEMAIASALTDMGDGPDRLQ